MNRAACTLPVATIPTSAFVNWIVLDVVFPLFATSSRVVTSPVRYDPSPMNRAACTLPVATKPIFGLVS